MDYRVYLLIDDHIRAVNEIDAYTDAEVVQFATQLFGSCDDVFDACEVWRGPKVVYVTNHLQCFAPERLIDASERRQRFTYEHELDMADSFQCVRSSMKLLTKLATLRELVAAHRPSDVADAI